MNQLDHAIIIVTFLVGLTVAYLLGKRRAPAPKKRLILPPGPPADSATAKIVEGWLTIIGMSPCPTDRFAVDGARVRPGYEGDVQLDLRLRNPPGKPDVWSVRIWFERASDGSYVAAPVRLGLGLEIPADSIGPEHVCTMTPPDATLLGRIV